MINEELSEREVAVWNAALEEAMNIARSERSAREAFPEEVAESWQAACDWIRARTKALLR